VIRALLFDAAGTLIEPAEPVAEVYARHFRESGWEIDPTAIRAAFGQVFAGTPLPAYNDHAGGDLAEQAWWRQVVFQTMAACGIDPTAEESSAAACFGRLFAHYDDPAAWSVFPEVPAVLAAAVEAGFRLAVVSNFDRRLHRILAGHSLSFERVLTSADACARKPDPAIFRQALALLDLSSAEAFHTGDSPAADGDGATAAGIRAFLLDRPGNNLRDFLEEALILRGK